MQDSPGIRSRLPYGERHASAAGMGGVRGPYRRLLRPRFRGDEGRGVISNYQTSGRFLDELEGFSQGPDAVLEAFRIQRRRFIETVSGFGPAEWQAASRCTAWSVHEVVRHVRDVVAIQVQRLGGRRGAFDLRGPFHPATTPNTWLAASESEKPAVTLRELISLAEEEDGLLALMVKRNPDETMQGPLRRPLHWSVNSLHTFWDAWMHERDIVLPLGSSPAYTATDLRLATMYGLLGAAAPAAWSEDHVRTTVLLDGSPDGCYGISPTRTGSVRVSATPGAAAELRGSVGEVIDSLAGRGPELRELFGVSTPGVSRLGLLRKVAT